MIGNEQEIVDEKKNKVEENWNNEIEWHKKSKNDISETDSMEIFGQRGY